MKEATNERSEIGLTEKVGIFMRIAEIARVMANTTLMNFN